MGHSLPETFLIPVETLNREFDAKLLLALKALQRGLKPVIGGRTVIHNNLPKFPRSIYFAKGIRTGNRLMMSILAQLGHIIVAQDEEALIRLSDEALWMMFDEETFNRPRLLYAWGSSNADVWRRYRGYRDTPILGIGNPRIDILRPELRGYYEPAVAELKQRYGRYVLFSSNFAIVNHFIPNHTRFRVAADAEQDRTNEIKSAYVDHKRQIFEAFKTMIPALARALSPDTLVIRPHPSENASLWSEICAGLDNVQVVHEGPIAPWIRAASCLVHNGCTSAVEAAIINTPAYAYRPVSNKAFDGSLPNALSHECLTARDVADAAAGSQQNQARLTKAQKAILAENISSIEGELCCDRILGSFEEHRDRLIGEDLPGLSGRIAGRVRHAGRQAVRSFTSSKRTGKSSAVYSTHKFPGISEAEVNERITRLAATMPSLPQAQACQIIDNVFEIRPA